MRKHESYEFTIFGRGQSIIRSLLDEIIEVGAMPDDSVKLYHSSFGYWSTRGLIHPRPFSSVILPNGVAEALLGDAKDFLAGENWYRSVGIPWHRGYLLHGVPGSGKTSIVSALAGELRMNVYLLNLAGGMDDERLNSLMSEVQPGSMVVMEDIDCTCPTRRIEGKGVTLSGLLNCLDGIQSREGCMIFMTTNHREALDSAILRPGRVDLQVEFHPADDGQIVRLKNLICPGIDDDIIVQECRGMTMAEVQQKLLCVYRHTPSR